MAEQRLMTLKEFARLMGRTPSAVTRWIADKKLPGGVAAERLGGVWYLTVPASLRLPKESP